MILIFNNKDGSCYLACNSVPNNDILEDINYTVVEYAEFKSSHIYTYNNGVVVDNGERVININDFELFELEYAAKEYQRLRKAEYPDLEDQLDALYHYFTDNNIENNFTNMLNEVKLKYPKPEVQ